LFAEGLTRDRVIAGRPLRIDADAVLGQLGVGMEVTISAMVAALPRRRKVLTDAAVGAASRGC
jgi:hypothetical protein